MSTIYDVAKLAGVGKSTVSRVINKNGAIKESTRLKVEAAMKELNYRPSLFAQGIKTGRSKTIALVVPDSTNLFYSMLLSGIEDIARKYGYFVMLCNGEYDSQKGKVYLEQLQERNIDGIIYCVYRKDEVFKDIFELSETVPVVFTDDPYLRDPTVSVVYTDGKKAVRENVDYLYKKGCRNIAFIGLEEICAVMYRFEGYKQGLKDHEIRYSRDLVYQAPYNWCRMSHFMLGAEGISQIMQSGKQVDAVIAATDMLAIGAISWIQENGYSVPGDIRVIGYDNIEISSIIRPKLSTISQPIRMMGNEAAELLFRKIEENNGINETIEMNTTFIEREST